MIENETPAAEEPSGNVLELPQSFAFLRCSLCRANIQASFAETQKEPAAWLYKDQDTGEETPYLFCAGCHHGRVNEIRSFIALQATEAYSEENNEYLEDFGQIKKKLLAGTRVFRVYKSSENSAGETLKILGWKPKNHGINSVALVCKDNKEHVLFYNLTGMSLYDFKLSVDYIATHYGDEFTGVEEVRSSTISLKNARIPIFKGRLIGMDSRFGFYENKESVSISVGYVETLIPKKDLSDFIHIFCSVSSFFDGEDLSELEEFKEIRATHENNQMRNVKIWSTRNKKFIIDTYLPSGKHIAVSGGPVIIDFQIDDMILKIPSFDFTDLSLGLERLPVLMAAKPLSRKMQKIGVLRKERYRWLGDYEPITFSFIMQDLGWNFEVENILDAV